MSRLPVFKALHAVFAVREIDVHVDDDEPAGRRASRNADVVLEEMPQDNR